eukprot:SM000398S15207  [mRNA]  locus=s398:29857:30837:+ [translate_table: standard]
MLQRVGTTHAAAPAGPCTAEAHVAVYSDFDALIYPTHAREYKVTIENRCNKDLQALTLWVKGDWQSLSYVLNVKPIADGRLPLYPNHYVDLQIQPQSPNLVVPATSNYSFYYTRQNSELTSSPFYIRSALFAQ